MMESSGTPVFFKERIAQLRGDPALTADASIVIPVNAQKDLAPLRRVLSDLAAYSGGKRLEIILVINNYPPDEPPGEIWAYQQAGIQTIAVPRVHHQGGIAMAARIPGVRQAQSQAVLLFDADCRIPDPNALIDWYVARLGEGCDLAYTH